MKSKEGGEKEKDPTNWNGLLLLVCGLLFECVYGRAQGGRT